MENQLNPTLAKGDLIEMSPMKQLSSILKPSQQDNLIMLQTPVHKNRKVCFITPQHTPAQPRAKTFSRNPSVTLTPTTLTSTPVLKASLTPSQPSVITLSEGKIDLGPNAESEKKKEKCKKWDHLRQLDEDLRWRERVEVITKLDHAEHSKYSTEYINEIINAVVDICTLKREVKEVDQWAVDENPPVDSNFKIKKHQPVAEQDSLKQCGIEKTTNIKPLVKAENEDVSNGQKSSSIGQKAYISDLDDIPDAAKSVMQPVPAQDVGNADPDRSQQPTQDTLLGNCMLKSNKPMKVSDSEGIFESSIINFDTSVFFTPAEITPPLPSKTFADTDFVDGAQLLAQGHFDLDFLERKTSGDVSNSLRKQSLFMKFDPLLEDSSRPSAMLIGRKSDIIDFTGRVTPQPQENMDETVLSPREPDLLCDSPSELCTTFDISQMTRGSTNDSVLNASSISAACKPDSGIVFEVLRYSEADLEQAKREAKEIWLKDKEASEKRCEGLESEIQKKYIICEQYRKIVDDHVGLVNSVKENNAKEMKDLQLERERLEKRMSALTKISTKKFKRTESLQKTLSNLQSNEIISTEHTKNIRKISNSRKKEILDLEKQLEDTVKSNSENKKNLEHRSGQQLNKLKLKLKSLELRAENVQSTLDHKKKENKELMQICDELVSSADATNTH